MVKINRHVRRTMNNVAVFFVKQCRDYRFSSVTLIVLSKIQLGKDSLSFSVEWAKGYFYTYSQYRSLTLYFFIKKNLIQKFKKKYC